MVLDMPGIGGPEHSCSSGRRGQVLKMPTLGFGTGESGHRDRVR